MTIQEILTIINTALILVVAVGGYYVRTVDHRVEKLERRVDDHHENASIHIDAPWRLKIEQRLDVIYDLLMKLPR